MFSPFGNTVIKLEDLYSILFYWYNLMIKLILLLDGIALIYTYLYYFKRIHATIH